MKQDTFLPMLHVDDAVDASIKLMDCELNKISLNQPYNISSFETSPSLWQKTILSIGYDLNVNYKIDFRQSIADSWPKKINDSTLRNDIKWAPKFGDFDTAKNILESI